MALPSMQRAKPTAPCWRRGTRTLSPRCRRRYRRRMNPRLHGPDDVDDDDASDVGRTAKAVHGLTFDDLLGDTPDEAEGVGPDDEDDQR